MWKLLMAGLVVALGIAPATASAEDECLVAPEGVVAWWPGDGSPADIEGGNAGVLVNGTTYGPGEVAGAFSFDGIDDYVQVPHSTALNIQEELTLDAWVYKTGWCGADRGGVLPNCILVVKQNAADSPTCCDHLRYGLVLLGQYNAKANHVGLSFWLGGWADRVYSLEPIADNEWTHVAGTYDGLVAKIYVDGLLSNSTDLYSGPIAATTEGPLYIGAARHGYDEFHNGLIDEVEVFDRALTGEEIAAIYQAGPYGKCKDEDGDGFRPPEDCDEGDPSVNPDALELPGNFIDENCDGNLGECDPCSPWRNHGEYVRCVAHEVNLAVPDLLTEEEGDALVSSAAQSDIGKRGFVAPECQ